MEFPSWVTGPIQDPDANLKIDLCHDLEIYLERIDNTPEDQLNFAEAGLVVQGAASVYSKEVDAVYNETYKVKDRITNCITNAQSTEKEGRKKRTVGSAQTRLSDWNDEDSDIGDDDHDTDRDDGDEDDYTLYSRNATVEASEVIKQATLLPKVPLFPPYKKNYDAHLVDERDQIIGNVSDFYLNKALVSFDGALSLQHMIIDDKRRSMSNSTESSPSFVKEALNDPVASSPQADNLPQDPANTSPLHDDQRGKEVADDPQTDNDQLVPEISQMLADAEEDENPPPTEDDSIIDNSQPKRKLRFPKMHQLASNDIDAHNWGDLDPYIEPRKFKVLKKKKIKIPSCLQEASNYKPDVKQCSLIKFVANEFFSMKSSLPKDPLKTLDFLCLEPGYWREYHRRLELRQQRRHELNKRKQDHKEEEQYQAAYEEGDDDDDGGDDIPIDDHHALFDVIAQSVNHPLPVHDQSNSPLDSAAPVTYEDLVHEHLKNIELANREWMTQSDQAVHEWEDRITPLLEEEELRPSFNVTDYEQRVIDCFKHDNEILSFSAVPQSSAREMARLFQATLHLANDYNVEILANEKTQEEFRLRLLSRELRAHQI